MSIEMNKKGAYQRQKMPGLVNVDRDDVLPNEIPVGEEVSFVSAYFGDYTDGYSNVRSILHDASSLDPELASDGSQVVWVENARTGEFLPVLVGGSSGMSNNNSGNHNDEHDNTNDNGDSIDESSPLIVPQPLDPKEQEKDLDGNGVMDNVENGDTSGHSYAGIFLRGLFLLFQGMLAGFNFISVSYLVLDNTQFLSTYQASANEVRRLSFILSTLAALGAVDNLVSLISRSNRPSLSGNDSSQYGSSIVKRENGNSFMFAVSACILYITALVLTVLLGGTDTLIYYQFGVDSGTGENWINTAITEHKSLITTWRQLVALRIAVAAIGWLCSCFLIWNDLVAKDERGAELVKLQDVITQWRHRVEIMEGNELEDMDVNALRKLVALQGLGYERTTAALNVIDNL